MLKQSFLIFPSFWISVYKDMENEHGQIQRSLDCPPSSILCLRVSVPSAKIPNPHAPTMEHATPVEAGPLQLIKIIWLQAE